MIRVKLILAELDVRDMTVQAAKIASAYRVTLEEMFADNRYPTGVFARQQFWAELYDPDAGWTISRIAKFMRRDRTTIRKGIDAHRRRLAAHAA